MNKEITLSDIAGYATERTVWQLILNLADHCGQSSIQDISPGKIIVNGSAFEVSHAPEQNPTRSFAAPESFAAEKLSLTSSSDVWTIGALAFYAITGMEVFEAKGGITQTINTEIPRISSAYTGRRLSDLIRQCLCFTPDERPSLEDIKRQADEALSCPPEPRKRLVGKSGKGYTGSLVKFWPDEMLPVLILCLLMLLPSQLPAQTASKFDRSAIPDAMCLLVSRCVDLRSPRNVNTVSKALDGNMKWTLMDELAVDSTGECSTKDPVDMFGLNDLGARIIKRHGGSSNVGGRFRDGSDPRYKYSLIEITVKRRSKVSYKISGRKGEQIFAVIPYDKNASFDVSIPGAEYFVENGIRYIQLKQGIHMGDTFTLTITNKSARNQAYILINYNSRNNE